MWKVVCGDWRRARKCYIVTSRQKCIWVLEFYTTVCQIEYDLLYETVSLPQTARFVWAKKLA